MNTFKDDYEIINLSEEECKRMIDEYHIPDDIKCKVLQLLPQGYEFLNYKYAFSNGSVYTFHRDVTSSKKYNSLKHKSYTFIVYFCEGPHLRISPNSATTHIFHNEPVDICGPYGQGICFDADAIHAACLGYSSNRKAIQYKIVHKDDQEKLGHLDKCDVCKTDQVRIYTLSDRIIQSLSLHTVFLHNDLPIFGQYSIENGDNEFIIWICKILQLDFYLPMN